MKPFSNPLKLKGATLVEVMVALSLISIIFVIGSLIWTNLSGPSAPGKVWDSRRIAREMLHEFETNLDAGEETKKVEGRIYKREIRPLNRENSLYEVTVVMFGGEGERVFERTKIIARDEN